MQAIMPTPDGIPAGARTGRQHSRLLMPILALLAASCSGSLSHRSIKQVVGDLDVPAGITKVRIVSRMGSLEVDAAPERRLHYRGECMRAADTAEHLAELETSGSEFRAAVDPQHPEVLVVSAPELPPDVDPLQSILGIEARIALPPDLEIEVEVSGSGHLTAVGRRAAVRLVTGRGDLRISRCQGPAVLRTGGGMTIVDGHAGDVDVHATVGDMQIWVRQPADTVKLVTGSGTIQCHLPPSSGFRLDGRTLQGKAGAAEFDIQPQPVLEFGRVIAGVYGDGRTAVLMHTGIGNLSLRAHTFE